MSNLNKVEPAKLSELQSGLTEVAFDSLNGGPKNDIKRFPLSPEFSHLAYEESSGSSSDETEWSQIFQLKDDTVLVCIVKAQKLEMRLMHMTDGPLDELKELIDAQGGSGLLSEQSSVPRTFLSTDKDVVEDLKKTFRRFQKAKVEFDAPIVANLGLIRLEGDKTSGGVYRPGKADPKLKEYELVLATKSNRVYFVSFDRHFLERNKTVFVEQHDPSFLAHLEKQRVSSFDVVHDQASGKDFMVFGCSTFVTPQGQLASGQSRSDLVKEALEGTLSFMDSERNVFTVRAPQAAAAGMAWQGAATGGAPNNASWFSRLAQNLPIIGVTNNANQAAAQQNRATPAQSQSIQATNKFLVATEDVLLAPEGNTKNLEGVVALKVLTNNLLVALYTNGLLRVIQISSFEVILETYLLPQTSSGKVVDATIAFKTHLAVADASQTTMSKSISLGVALSLEQARSSQKMAVLTTFSLICNDFQASLDQSMEDLALFNNSSCELVCTRSQAFTLGTQLTALAACDNSAFLYATYDPTTKQSSIQSTSLAQPIWDRDSREIKEQIADQLPIPIDLLRKTPQLIPVVKEHYFERMTVEGRFSPGSIETLLKEDNLYDLSLSLKANLRKAINSANLENIQQFLANLTTYEATQNGRVLAIGGPGLQKWRAIVRPLGVSMLAETSHVSAVAAQVSLAAVEGEQYWAMSDSKLLIKYLSLLRSTVQDSLHLFKQRVIEQPSQLRQAAEHCLRLASKDHLKHQIEYLLESAGPDVSDQMTFFTDKVLYKLLLAQSAKPGTKLLSSAQMGTADSLASQRVLEGQARHETAALYECLVDLYFGQLILLRALASNQCYDEAKARQSIRKVESWLLQVAALNRVFNSDSQTGTVLTELMAGLAFSEEPLIVRIVQAFTYNSAVTDLSAVEKQAFIPSVVMQLIDLKQYQAALDYLKVTSLDTLGTKLAQLYSKIQLANAHANAQGRTLSSVDKSRFMTLAICLIRQTLQLTEKEQAKLSLQDGILSMATQRSASKTALIDRIEGLCTHSQDKRLDFILLCATELVKGPVGKSQDSSQVGDNLASFFVVKCLEMERSVEDPECALLAPWSSTERDYLLKLLFEAQRADNLNISLLYRAVTSMSDLSTRQAHLLKFFEKVGGPSRPQAVRSAIYTSCTFSQTDITLLIEAVQNKLTSLFTTKDALSLKWRDQACTLVQTLSDVCEVYNWQDQFVRFAWSSYEDYLQKVAQRIGASVANQRNYMEQVLTLIVQLFTDAYSACESCGEDFYFNSPAQVKVSQDQVGRVGRRSGASQGRKRTFVEASMDSSAQMEVDSDASPLKDTSARSQSQTDSFWQVVDAKRAQPSAFNSGKLVRIDSAKIKEVLLLNQAKLQLQSEMPTAVVSDDPLYLSQVLAELDQTSLAVQLALACKVSPAFAIASKLDTLAKLDLRDGEDAEEEAMRQERIAQCLDTYLEVVPVEYLSELAQYLISMQLKLSSKLKSLLVKHRQVAYVIGCYLAPEVQDIVEAVIFLTEAGVGQESHEAVKILIHSDLNQVVSLLMQATTASSILSEEREDLQKSLDEIKATCANSSRSRTFHAAGSMASLGGISSLKAVMGQGTAIEALLADKEIDSGVFDTTKDLERQLGKVDLQIRQLGEGTTVIKQVLQKETR